jgi:hypothetical protein
MGTQVDEWIKREQAYALVERELRDLGVSIQQDGMWWDHEDPPRLIDEVNRLLAKRGE